MGRKNIKTCLFICDVFQTFKEFGIELSDATKQRVMKDLDRQKEAELTWNDLFKNEFGGNSRTWLWRISYEDRWKERAHNGVDIAHSMIVESCVKPAVKDEDFIKELIRRPRKTPFGAGAYDLIGTFHSLKLADKKSLSASIYQITKLVRERNHLMTDEKFNADVKAYREKNAIIQQLRKENTEMMNTYVTKMTKKLALKREAERLS